MEKPFETIYYKGYIIEIYQEEFPEDPRSWDNIGTMTCFHSRYRLGDKHNFSDPSDLEESLKNEKYVSLPIFMYDHGGISLSTRSFNDRWDSGQVGIIYATYEKIKKEWSRKRVSHKFIEKIKDILKAEIEIYSKWVNGEVYSYRIKQDNGNDASNLLNNQDSCSGFYETNEAIDDAKSSIDDNSHQKSLTLKERH